VNCPHCDHPDSRISETRANPDHDRRIRLCRGCGKTFTTIERVAVYAGRAAGWIESQVEPEAEGDPEPAAITPMRRKSPERFVASPSDPLLEPFQEEVRALLLSWWNESRLSKHRAKAAWTEAAWKGNLVRLAALPHWKQLLLAQAGVEQGWQALKPEYIKDAAPPAVAGLQPKSSAMQSAIEQWNGSLAG
jgi:hypothetical protein